MANINVLVIRPSEFPEVMVIQQNIIAVQELLGGKVNFARPYKDEPKVALLSNADAELCAHPAYNIPLFNYHGLQSFPVYGTCILTGLDEHGIKFIDLSNEQIDKFTKYYTAMRITMNEFLNTYTSTVEFQKSVKEKYSY